jgi:hypothetical protein
LEFNIIKTVKKGIDAGEHFIVELDNTIYLRAVECKIGFCILTATASEDDSVIKSYPDQKKLIDVARKVIKLDKNLKDYEPTIKEDFCGRAYLEVCYCEYISDVYRYAEVFLQALYSHNLSEQECG